MITEYKSLMEAAQVLEAAKSKIANEDGAYTSPAWKMVFHAQEHVTKIATLVLRGAE